jgi:hypothetical protein
MWKVENFTNITDCWEESTSIDFFSNLTFATNFTAVFNDVPRSSTLNVPYTVSLTLKIILVVRNALALKKSICNDIF